MHPDARKGWRRPASSRPILARIDQDLVLARLEPRSVRPDAAWIERLERAGAEIGALCSALVLGPGSDARAGAALGARLGALADSLEGRPGPAAPAVADSPGAGRPAWEPFQNAVEEGLGRLEATLATREPSGEGAADAVPARS